MSQSTKRFRKTASACALSLVAALVPVTAIIPASAAPVQSGNLSVTRTYDSSTNSFQAYSGERLNVNFSYEVKMTSVDVGDILTFDDLENEITGLSVAWTINNDYMNRVNLLSYTVPTPKPTAISLTVSKTLNPSVSGLIKFDPVVTTSGDTLSAGPTYTIVSLNGSITSAGYTAKVGDQSLYYYGTVCVDMTKVIAGDDLVASTTLSGSATPTYNAHYWSAGFGASLDAISPQTDLERTVPTPEPSEIKLNYDKGFAQLTSGVKYTFSGDIKNDGISVAITCPRPPGPPPGLFPVGGASVSGKFSIGSKITVTPNKWSLTDGGAIDATVTTDYGWFLCDSPLLSSTTNFAEIDCFQDEPLQVLANGTSVGTTNGPNQGFTGSSLTITQGLLTAMTGKHLMVIVNGKKGTDLMAKRGNLFMQSCGPIASGSTCASTYGTPTVVKTNQTFTALPKNAKAGKSVSIEAATKQKVAVKVVVSGNGCKVAAVKDKNKKVVSHKLTMGAKGVTCKVTVTAVATSTLNAFSYVANIKAT